MLFLLVGAGPLLLLCCSEHFPAKLNMKDLSVWKSKAIKQILIQKKAADRVNNLRQMQALADSSYISGDPSRWRGSASENTAAFGCQRATLSFGRFVARKKCMITGDTTKNDRHRTDQIAGSRCLPARRRVGGEKTVSGKEQEKMIFTAVRKRRLEVRDQL